MLLKVNGETTEAIEGCTVSGLLEQRGLVERPCAVEVNRALVPHRQHPETTLIEGDEVEIVTLVGGG